MKKEDGDKNECEKDDLKDHDGFVDMYDPRNWTTIKKGWNEWRDFMVIQGLTKRLPVDYKFPRDGAKRHFSQFYYTREMGDGSKQDRRWLVYSKLLNKIFCFCCKLFNKHDNGQLASIGFSD